MHWASISEHTSAASWPGYILTETTPVSGQNRKTGGILISSKSSNITTTLWIEGRESSASWWEIRDQNWYWRGDGWIWRNGLALTKLEEIHRNLVILSLHWHSRALGPQRAYGRERGKTVIGKVGWRVNLHKWSSFDEIGRNMAVLSIHWESRFWGLWGASGRQRLVDF